MANLVFPTIKCIKISSQPSGKLKRDIVSAGTLLDGNDSLVKDLHTSLKKPAPVKHLWTRAKSRSSVDEESGTYKGLGGAIVGVCTLKPTDKQLRKILSDYKIKDSEKCVVKMKEATKLFLDSILQSKKLKDKIHKFFTRQVKDIDAIAKMIPDFLKADLELMETLRTELSSTETNLREMFPILLKESESLLGKCDLFYVNYIFRFDYSLLDLQWDPMSAPVGKGSFADVYIGQIKTSTYSSTPVALKVCRDPLRENTVTDILLEDRILR